MRILLFFLIGLFAFINFTFAHGDELSLSDTISDTSISVVTLAGILIILLVVLAVAKKEKSEVFSRIVFILIALITLGATFYLAASTIYLNIVSETKGPVHWHADFRIFDCGNEVLLEEPTGLSNRIGRADLHEHGDGRIHIEGVVTELQDVSLGEFFESFGGTLTAGEIAFPGRDGSDRWMVNG
ncbi:MAG: hypothetical protein G01um101413_978, partial [Parcubacteria group bacterium Gr01-1014_13]